MSRSGGDFSGGGGGSSGGNKEYFVDTKLVFRLKQFVGEQQGRGGAVTEDAAVDFLLDKYKEYVRKPQVGIGSLKNESRECDSSDVVVGVCVEMWKRCCWRV